MKTKASLVGADRAVELYTVTVVDLYLTLVVYPGNSEQDGTLGSGQSFQKGFLSVLLLIGLDHNTKAFENFLDCLMEFGLCGVLGYYSFQCFINV